MLFSILIEAISLLALALFTVLILVFQYFRRQQISKVEFVIGIILSFILIGYSAKTFVHASKPEITTKTMVFQSCNRPRYKLGLKCYFDDSGEVIGLYIDPFTQKNFIKGTDLKKNEKYIVSYEKNEEIIIKIYEDTAEK